MTGTTMTISTHACALGKALVATTPRGVCAIVLGDDDGALHVALGVRFPEARTAPAANDLVHAARARLALAMLDGHADEPPPLDLVGTDFERRVYDALRAIPAGETRTYSQIAERVGAPAAVRAVGTACGKNPVACIVPCHRVLRRDGSLGGYRWGLARKRALLDRERANRRAAAR